ncbi:MAG: hypothetical protein D3904_04940 [Candidatus Electrothrix sp. EH2]|nr:hypothetical protein [Candidatus Electrothrix sp. EH2]
MTQKTKDHPNSAGQDSQDEAMHLKEHVEDAQLMLAYASEQGIQIDSNLVTDIVTSRYSLQKNEFDRDKEITFWTAFNTLSKKIHPVCINSLKATRNYSGAPNKSEAERTVLFYQTITFIVLITLLCVQIYWGVGSVIIAQITKNQSFQKEIESLAKVQGEIAILFQTNESEKGTVGCESVEILVDKYQDKQIDIKRDTAMYYELLECWYAPVSLLTKKILSKDTTSHDYAGGEYIKERQSAQLVLQPIQQYILPLLYGWIGALAYVLRNINREVAEITYTRQSKEHYRLRVQLGTLSGLAVGWFLSVDPATSSSFSFGNLSPLALSFLAGYSVELLFSAADKIVEAFSGTAISQSRS